MYSLQYNFISVEDCDEQISIGGRGLLVVARNFFNPWRLVRMSDQIVIAQSYDFPAFYGSRDLVITALD